MENCEIHVGTPILSELVQKKLFKSGVEWSSKEKEIQMTNFECLYVREGFITASHEIILSKNDLPKISVKELLGDFDWCIDVRELTEKQKQYVNEVFLQNYHFSWNFYGYSSDLGELNYRYEKWGTELDWESFMHLYPNAQEIIPQVEEEQIKQQTTMKFKVGDEVEFITDDNRIPPYSTNCKLELFIKHGRTTFQENKGIINYIVGEHYMVEYTDIENRKVQLGFKEDVLKLKTKTIMTSQYLTRDQLIILLDEFECPTWKKEIIKLLSGHEFSVGDTKIDVTASISKLISEGTLSQKSAVQNLGITLVKEKSIKIDKFPTIYHGNKKLLEIRISENVEFDEKSIFLGRDFNWEIKKDGGDVLCLVPTKK